MKKYLVQITIGLLATAMVVVSMVARAQEVNTNASSTANQTVAPKPKKHKVIPFHGKLAAVDIKNMTLKVGKRTFQVTPDTRIFRYDHPAALSEGVVGEPVRGSYNKAEDGKLSALSVYFGPKIEKKQKQPAEDET